MKDAASYKGVIHALVKDTDPILSQVMPRFDFDNPVVDPIQLAYDLVESMRHHKGIGLSANQIGLPYRVFVMHSSPTKVCFNPRVVTVSHEVVLLDEGCLSHPNLFVKVKRPERVKVRYQDATGKTFTEHFIGMTARVFLHELDHMEGKHFTSRANPVHLERARREQKKINRHLKSLKEV